MAKAKIKLLNGTEINIEGTVEEIKELLEYYSAQNTKNKSSQTLKTKSKSVGLPSKTKPIDQNNKNG